MWNWTLVAIVVMVVVLFRVNQLRPNLGRVTGYGSQHG